MALTDKLTAVADAIREKGNTTDKMTLAEMPDKIKAISGGSTPTAKKWVRPADWPDLDAAWANHKANGGGDAIFLLVKYCGAEESLSLQLQVKSGTYKIEWGRIENGAFITEEIAAKSQQNNTAVDCKIPSSRDYAVAKLSPVDDGVAIICFYQNSGNYAPILEVTGKMSAASSWQATYTSDSGTSQRLSKFCTIRYSVSWVMPQSSVDWSYLFNYCRALQSVDLSGWDTSACTTLNLSNAFSNCYSLEIFNPCVPMSSSATSYSNSSLLNHDSLVAIIAALPTVTSEVKLTLHATAKARLSADEIAIATTKGWTVA